MNYIPNLLASLRRINHTQCQPVRLDIINELKEAVLEVARWFPDQQFSGQDTSCGLGTGQVFQLPRGAILVVVDCYSDPGETAPCGCYYGYFSLSVNSEGDTTIDLLPDIWCYGYIFFKIELNPENRLRLYQEVLTVLRKQFS